MSASRISRAVNTTVDTDTAIAIAQATTTNQSALPGLAGIGLMAGLAACGLGLAACGLGLAACGLGLVACGLGLVACGLGLVACGLGETDGPGAEAAVSGEDTETVGWGEDAAGA